MPHGLFCPCVRCQKKRLGLYDYQRPKKQKRKKKKKGKK